jgi:Zn finger protein HypA/HybF involved in hydrogenase expression
MPAWPGGPCPECGEDMPPALIHCINCRALLNPDLREDSVEIPAFVPLEEISAMSEVEAAGYYVHCPKCQQELRVSRKYAGARVQCKFCKVPFTFDLQGPATPVQAFYAECPECHEELRAAPKYMGQKVACKFCGAKIRFVPGS